LLCSLNILYYKKETVRDKEKEDTKILIFFARLDH